MGTLTIRKLVLITALFKHTIVQYKLFILLIFFRYNSDAFLIMKEKNNHKYNFIKLYYNC